MNNKIITRIAAFIDNKGNKNTEIDQAISTEYFNDIFKSQIFFLKLDPSADLIENTQIYDNYIIINGIGLAGISYLNNNNQKIIIEFQVGQLAQNSIIQMNNYITTKLDQFSYKNQIASINRLENKFINKYYLGIILIYKNLNLIKTIPHFYSRNYSIIQLKQIGEQLINQYKNKY